MLTHTISQLVPLTGGSDRTRATVIKPVEQAVETESVQGNAEPQNSSKDAPLESDFEAAVTQLNEYVQKAQIDLEFSIDEESGRSVIKVIDPETKEVIRQYPMEELLALSRHVKESTGMLLNTRA